MSVTWCDIILFRAIIKNFYKIIINLYSIGSLKHSLHSKIISLVYLRYLPALQLLFEMKESFHYLMLLTPEVWLTLTLSCFI